MAARNTGHRVRQSMMPLLLALRDLPDPAIRGTILRGLAGAALVFVALLAGAVWFVSWLAQGTGWIAWALEAASGLAALLLAVWLFIPVAVAISALFVDRVAEAVERRRYPGLPPAHGASVLAQAGGAAAIFLQALLLNLFALPLLLIPGVGIVALWAVAAWVLGRELFEQVAARRMTQGEAVRLRRSLRVQVFVTGGLLALLASVPFLNLLVPPLGTAAMVHVLHGSRKS